MRKPILALAVVLVSTGIALADVTYEEEMTMGGMMKMEDDGRRQPKNDEPN